MEPSAVTTELQEAAENASRRVRDPAAMRKACEEMDRIREDVKRRLGTVDLAVQLYSRSSRGMRYVLDSNVAIKWVLNELHSISALKVRDDFLGHIHELVAPDVFPVEIAHALSRAERKGALVPPQGTTALTGILQILPDLHESLLLLPRAFEISSQERIGVYDCLYLALAEKEKIPTHHRRPAAA
jgi:predicted nucleic acid-binding protein